MERHEVEVLAADLGQQFAIKVASVKFSEDQRTAMLFGGVLTVPTWLLEEDRNSVRFGLAKAIAASTTTDSLGLVMAVSVAAGAGVGVALALGLGLHPALAILAGVLVLFGTMMAILIPLMGRRGNAALARALSLSGDLRAAEHYTRREMAEGIATMSSYRNDPVRIDRWIEGSIERLRAIAMRAPP